MKTKLARMLLPAWISGVRVLRSEKGKLYIPGDLMDDLACVIGQRDDRSQVEIVPFHQQLVNLTLDACSSDYCVRDNSYVQ
jgi:hypothetical protein